MRLQRYLAMSGVASRRKSEELIADGRVRVNGAVADKPGTIVDPQHDRVELDGKAVRPVAEPVCYLLYKECGVVSTCNDPQGRRTVMDYFQGVRQRLYPVGRLDFDTEGLLLMTNDGALAYRLTHPKYEVEKTYEAVVRGKITPAQMQRLESGIEIEGKRTAPAHVEMLVMPGERSTLHITIREGRNRQVRKMFAAIGHPVIRLKRDRFGSLTLGGLKPGQRRKLTPDEIQNLMDEGTAAEMAAQANCVPRRHSRR